jgi:hypothetical protein
LVKSSSSREIDDAAERAIAESERQPTRELIADYLDFLVKNGYLVKKANLYGPTPKFGFAWAEATLVVIAKANPAMLEGDHRGSVALVMAKTALGVDEKNIDVGGNPEELVRLANTIFNFAKNYFPVDFIQKMLESED